jgi:hypothetical protein
MTIASIAELPYPDFTGFATGQPAEETIDKICEYLKSQHRALAASEGDKPGNYKEAELLARRFTFFLTGKSGVNVQPVVTSAHASTHQAGGADSIKLDDLAAPDNNTDLDFSASAHGLVPKGTNVGDFLEDDGTWSTISTHTQNTDTALGSGCVAADHGTAATDMVVNVCYGTGSPPSASTTTIGTLFIKYTA